VGADIGEGRHPPCAGQREGGRLQDLAGLLRAELGVEGAKRTPSAGATPGDRPVELISAPDLNLNEAAIVTTRGLRHSLVG
jgi:hypothetical protein